MSSSRDLGFWQVDAFASQPFQGNPAAVCLLGPTKSDLDDSLRQKIAAEFNLSETAFVTLPAAASPPAVRHPRHWFPCSDAVGLLYGT